MHLNYSHRFKFVKCDYTAARNVFKNCYYQNSVSLRKKPQRNKKDPAFTNASDRWCWTKSTKEVVTLGCSPASRPCSAPDQELHNSSQAPSWMLYSLVKASCPFLPQRPDSVPLGEMGHQGVLVQSQRERAMCRLPEGT